MTNDHKKHNILIELAASKMQKVDGKLSTTSFTQFTRAFANSVPTSNNSKIFDHDHNKLNYPLYVAVPIGAVLLIVLLIFLVSCFIYLYFHNYIGCAKMDCLNKGA